MAKHVYPTYNGKTKSALTYEAFLKHGFDCTSQQWQTYLNAQGCDATSDRSHQTIYYRVKKDIGLMRDGIRHSGKNLTEEKVRRYMKDQGSETFNDNMYKKLVGLAQAPARTTPAKSAKSPTRIAPAKSAKLLTRTTPAKSEVAPTHEQNGVAPSLVLSSGLGNDLGSTLRRYHRFCMIVDKVGADAVRDFTKLVDTVGVEGVNQMLEVYAESKTAE